MTGRRKKWLIGIGAVTVTVLVALSVTGYVLANRLEPYIRTQAIAYLQSRFDSDVELAAVRVRMPEFSPIQVLFRRGRGVRVGVEGDGVLLRHKGRRDLPPMFSMKKFSFDVDLGTLFDETNDRTASSPLTVWKSMCRRKVNGHSSTPVTTRKSSTLKR